jgi:hypothetical protein
MLFVIPKELAVVLNAREVTDKVESADGDDTIALGFVSYRDAGTNQIHHKSSMDKWGDKNMLRFSYINEPTTGFRVVGFVSRWSTSNKFIRIEDPRGFQFEVSIDNFVDLLRETTVVNAIIQDKVVYGWDDAGISLYKENSKKYLEGKENFEDITSPTVSMRSINIGNIIKLKNGKTVQYCGSWYYIQYDWNDYLFYKMNGITPPQKHYRDQTPPTVKKGYLLKENNDYSFVASLTVKKILGTELFDEADFLLRVRQELTERYARWQATKEIMELKLEREWQSPKYIAINNKFGLDDMGRNLLKPLIPEATPRVNVIFVSKTKFDTESLVNLNFNDIIV